MVAKSISSLTFAVCLGACTPAPTDKPHDISIAGNKTGFNFDIGYWDTFPAGFTSVTVIIAVPGPANEPWYEECWKQHGSGCGILGKYHIKIVNQGDKVIILDESVTASNSYPTSSSIRDRGLVFQSSLVKTRLTPGHYFASIENLENSDAPNPVGKIWLDVRMK